MYGAGHPLLTDGDTKAAPRPTVKGLTVLEFEYGADKKNPHLQVDFLSRFFQDNGEDDGGFDAPEIAVTHQLDEILRTGSDDDQSLGTFQGPERERMRDHPTYGKVYYLQNVDSARKKFLLIEIQTKAQLIAVKQIIDAYKKTGTGTEAHNNLVFLPYWRNNHAYGTKLDSFRNRGIFKRTNATVCEMPIRCGKQYDHIDFEDFRIKSYQAKRAGGSVYAAVDDGLVDTTIAIAPNPSGGTRYSPFYQDDETSSLNRSASTSTCKPGCSDKVSKVTAAGGGFVGMAGAAIAFTKSAAAGAAVASVGALSSLVSVVTAPASACKKVVATIAATAAAGVAGIATYQHYHDQGDEDAFKKAVAVASGTFTGVAVTVTACCLK